MTTLETILARSAKAQPRRLAGASTRYALPEKPFALFLRFPPPRFLEKEKGFFCRVRYLPQSPSGNQLLRLLQARINDG